MINYFKHIVIILLSCAGVVRGFENILFTDNLLAIMYVAGAFSYIFISKWRYIIESRSKTAILGASTYTYFTALIVTLLFAIWIEMVTVGWISSSLFSFLLETI